MSVGVAAAVALTIALTLGPVPLPLLSSELEPLFGDLRGDARYERLLRRVGLQKR
jgi:hypothetical protein